jgi:hypothetical protein
VIVRAHGESLLLITQPDHAALSGRLMRAWTSDGLADSPRRDDILLAIREHDNGWREIDAAPLVDPSDGALLDFVHTPEEIKRGVWPRGVARLAPAPYAAALVAEHAIHIYSAFRTDPAWSPFFDEMTRTRDEHLARARGPAVDDLRRDYAFLRLGDLFSLVFCRAWPDPPTADFGYAFELEGDDLVVSPDPFGGESIPLEITARVLPGRPFTSPNDAREAFTNAPVWTLSGHARGERI